MMKDEEKGGREGRKEGRKEVVVNGTVAAKRADLKVGGVRTRIHSWSPQQPSERKRQKKGEK